MTARLGQVGLPVIVSDVLPVPPSAGEVGRRIARYGLADVLDWLGEELGPAPETETHVVWIDGTLHVSPVAFDQLKRLTP